MQGVSFRRSRFYENIFNPFLKNPMLLSKFQWGPDSTTWEFMWGNFLKTAWYEISLALGYADELTADGARYDSKKKDSTSGRIIGGRTPREAKTLLWLVLDR